ncbi:uncharacterized protein P884DRAFT_265664 [Thermothelomyces heterothallicus CBS 202.75]|uniref:uncharacterized protein n=1 Tax=Thermothelomyces heterothallicus CBS 202.75 TaxID=1149848 RepID=UPI0037433EBF
MESTQTLDIVIVGAGLSAVTYSEAVVSRVDCSSHIRLRQECAAAEWLEDDFLWRVHFVERDSGKRLVQVIKSPHWIAPKGNGSVPAWQKCVCFPDFPNLFFLTGSNTLPSSHSALVNIECSAEYILRVIGRLDNQNASKTERVKIQVTPRAGASFNNWIQKKLRGIVYTPRVRSCKKANREDLSLLSTIIALS